MAHPTPRGKQWCASCVVRDPHAPAVHVKHPACCTVLKSSPHACCTVLVTYRTHLVKGNSATPQLNQSLRVPTYKQTNSSPNNQQRRQWACTAHVSTRFLFRNTAPSKKTNQNWILAFERLLRGR